MIDHLRVVFTWRKRALIGLLRQKLHKPWAPHGPRGIKELGHRRYVGGMWDKIGKLQFDFLLAEGLKSTHCLLDIGCGSLRGGTYFIRYLAPGNYLGLDCEKELIETGLEVEVGTEVVQAKHPEFVVSDIFEFSRFRKKPDFSIAISLFTHLKTDDIRTCLTSLRHVVNSGHWLYASFFYGDSSSNRVKSHSHVNFHYSDCELSDIASECGWSTVYMGDWSHPRNQVMMKFIAH